MAALTREPKVDRAFIRIRYNERRAHSKYLFFENEEAVWTRAGPVGDRFTLNGGQTRHVARRGMSRSKVPTLPSFAPRRPITPLPYAPFISHRRTGGLIFDWVTILAVHFINSVAYCAI